MSNLIFGYTWEQIKGAQQGRRLGEAIKGAPGRPAPHPHDLELLEKHGAEWLYDNDYYGVIDRLGLPAVRPAQGAQREQP